MIRLPAEILVDGPTALRRWRDEDVPAIVAAVRDPEIPRWTSVPQTYTAAEARAYVRVREDEPRADRRAPFAIVAADDSDRLLGSISLMRFAWEQQRGEVGYWLAADARGLGHATRALRLICEWGFKTLPLERIELLAATGNAPSQRVAERAGFTREAVLRSYAAAKDGRQDMVVFALLAA